MKINIKKHILFQLIVTILYMLIWFIIKGLYISLLTIVSYLVVLGVMNMIYLNVMLYKYRYQSYLSSIFLSIVFVVYFWGLFIIISPAVFIADFVSLILRSRNVKFGAKRVKDWFVQREEIELNKQEKDLYNSFVNKYKVIYFVMGALILSYLIIVVLVSKLIESYIVGIVICLLILVIELSVYIVIESIIGIKAIKIVDETLYEDCNSKSYCNILHNLENRYNQFTIASFYINGLIYDGQRERLPYLFYIYDTHKNNVNYKIMLFTYIDDNDERFEQLYFALRKTFLKRVNNGKRYDQYKGLIQCIEARMLMRNKQYEDALQLLQSMCPKHKLSKVNIEFKIGVCLYEVGQIEDSKEKFLWIVENGNSLEYVDLANDYLSSIK